MKSVPKQLIYSLRTHNIQASIFYHLYTLFCIIKQTLRIVIITLPLWREYLKQSIYSFTLAVLRSSVSIRFSKRRRSSFAASIIAHILVVPLEAWNRKLIILITNYFCCIVIDAANELHKNEQVLDSCIKNAANGIFQSHHQEKLTKK